jgi:hypothetical protein
MADARKLRLICSTYCGQYKTDAKFYIDDAHPSGHRQLVVLYEKGGYQGRPEFEAGIPDDWSSKDVEELLLWPMKDPNAPWPAWEVAARGHGSPVLFRWWAGEKKP